MRLGSILRLETRFTALGILVIGSLSWGWAIAPASAQNIMRSPNLNINSRVPTMPNIPTTPNVPNVTNIDRGPSPIVRIDPNLAGRGVSGMGNNLRTQTTCTAADRDNGNCAGQVTSNGQNRRGKRQGQGQGGRGNATDTALATRMPANEIIAEIDSVMTDAQAAALARRGGSL